jgi:diguanylate cyclase (GGDEF)-like protein
LISVAALLRERLRRSDIVARWGGEEFIFLMPDASQSAAYVKANEIGQYVQDCPLVLDDKRTVALSASFGAAQRQAGDKSIEAVILRADCALYQSKAAGKNRVTVSAGQIDMSNGVRSVSWGAHSYSSLSRSLRASSIPPALCTFT